MKNRDAFTKNQISKFNLVARRAYRQNDIFIDTLASRYEFDTVVSFMPNIAKSTILDIGCGIGRFAIPMAKIAKHVTGIDLSTESIQLLRKKAKKEHLNNITAEVVDFHKMPIKKKFDYVLLVNVFHHIRDIDAFLHKVQTVLKQGGALVIFEFNPLNPLFLPYLVLYSQVRVHMNKEYFRSNIWTFRRILARARFSIDTFHRYSFLPATLYNIHPFFLTASTMLNSIPVLNIFCAFHIVVCRVKNAD